MEQMNIPALNHHVGSTERVFVAHVNDLNDFYLHSELVRDSLVKLGQDLYNEYSESLTKSVGIQGSLKVGEYCACPSESEDWYRGIIRQIDSNGFAMVFKVDYGDVQCIPIHFLRPLQERFFKLHRLAFHCSLVNLLKPINGWPLEIIKEFHSRLTTTFLYAKLINYNEVRDISEVEITEKSSKTSLNKDFEPYQIERSALQINDKLIYKYIPMEILDPNQPNQIRILYYITPRRFYVYLREKLNSHTSFQIDLQKAIQTHRPISSPTKYQPVAAQDNHAIWHRAIILDISYDLLKVCIYFTDIGQKESISINNIRLLPEEFQRKPAFAIPCSLYNVNPFNGNDQTLWKSNDQIHDELSRLIVNNVTCQVRAKHDQICYDIEIDIPKVGDLGKFLFEKNLISRTTMQNSQRSGFSSGQPPQQASFTRPQVASTGIPPSRQQFQRSTQPNDYYNNPNNMTQQQQQTRMLNTGPQNSTLASSSTISTVSPQDGFYTIMQVHSIVEFYGLSQFRERELEGLSQYLEDYYSSANDLSLNVSLFLEGTACVIQQNDKYHRVTIKRRESETRVLVKLVDRGDEIIVDTSELLQSTNQCNSVPAFAQPFRLHGYDESQISVNITRSLKKLILNQRVQITQKGPTMNGFYPVEVTINGNQSVNQMLSNDKNLSVTSPISNNRPNYNQVQPTHIESQVFSNSARHHSAAGQDFSGRSTMGHRTNDVLPAPQKILTAPTRTQPGRFGGMNQPGSVAPSTNEQTPRFSNPVNHNPQQQSQTHDPNPGWNKDQNNRPNFISSGPTNQPQFGRQQSGPTQSGNNQRQDDFKITIANNNQNRFSSTNSENQQRSFGSGFSHDDRNDKQMSGNNFQRNNDGANEGGFRRGGGISNRGGGFADRGGRGGFNDRNMTRNNDENNSQPSGGFPRRGGGEGFSDRRGFGDRGNRGRNFQDRNGGNRNQDDDNNAQRSQNFNSNRGGFQNRRDQGEGGGFERRGGSRGGRGGGFGDRGRGGGRGGQFSSRDRGDFDIQLTSDNNPPLKSNASWSSNRPPTANFESGDRFIENEIPKETFKFVISHIENANDFFIQLLSRRDELEKLTEILQNEYKQAPEGNLSSYKIDQPCLVKFSDNCWYRASILSNGVATRQIRFIDFGNTTNAEAKTIRQLAKKHCAAAPYAYRCTFKNVEVAENVNKESIVDKCAQKEFNGKIITKGPNGKFILESDDFLKLLLEINAIKLKSEVTSKRIKCSIAHIEPEQQRFYIQDDKETVGKIAELIEIEDKNTPTLSLDEFKQLEPNTKFIAPFEDEPYRAIIQSDESDENIHVCYIDFGNTSSCSKTSLKRCSERLNSYPQQAKHCQLYGISSNELNNAFKLLEDNSDPEKNVEISIINEKDQILKVLVYIDNECINEKFGYDPNSIENNDTSTETDDQSSITTATTVKEQEQSTSAVEKQSSPDTSDIQIKSDSSKSLQGLLTHIETTKPTVYLQLIPDSETIIDQINELIQTITEENKHNPSYQINDHVIAQFSDDDCFYRAKILSHSAEADLYTVYFLDYGNIDENVPLDRLYSYSEDLERIEPQVHEYLIDNFDSETWNQSGRSLLEDKVNDTIEFDIIDEAESIIHLKIDFTESTKSLTGNISSIDKDCFYIQILSDENLHIDEIEEALTTFNKEHKDNWSINEICIVSDEKNLYYRGQILSIDDNKYDIKCIDYGNTLQNITNDHLFVLPDEEIFKNLPLAHQCRLYENEGIEDIKDIPSTELVTINIENDRNDECWLVTLTRENNDQYLYDNNNTIENENKEESDNEEKTTGNTEQLTTENEVVQIENNSELSITNNQTIDFGENDPSTTIKDETNNSISSN